MNFADWTHALSERGLRIVAPSHRTPIQVCAVVPGRGFVLFRCRGTRVTMEHYLETAVLVTTPASSRGCECGRSHGVDPLVADGADPFGAATSPRYIVPDGAQPAAVAAYDGTTDRGWSGHEAGLLRPDEAAPLFDTLLARILGSRNSEGSGNTPGSAVVRDGLVTWEGLEPNVRRGSTQRESVRVRRHGLAGSSL
jgi:hypothetical protein